MKLGFALGNGQSRLRIDPAELRKHGLVGGCNRIYEDHHVDILVATDRNMAAEIEQSGYARNNEMWTRRPIPDFGARLLKRPEYGFSSGPALIEKMFQKGCKKIYAVGFDMGSPTEFVNNIYAGTAHYKTPSEQPTFYGNWVNQFKQISEMRGNRKIIRVLGPESTPMEWDRTNISEIDLNTFTNKINSL